MHSDIAARAIQLLTSDDRVEGLYLSGSFASGEPDDFSDIDLYVVVGQGMIEEVIRDHRRTLIPRVGDVATVFPATHLGDPHQIIVFYQTDIPIHVDYQYRASSELVPRRADRDVVLLLDRTGDLTRWLEACRVVDENGHAADAERLQYLEDRFWGWCWYAYSKIERGEAWEARDAIEYMRTNVLVVLATMAHGHPYEGNRRLERMLPEAVLDQLELTIPSHSVESYRSALTNSISLYLTLFEALPENLRSEVVLVDRDFFSRSFKTLASL